MVKYALLATVTAKPGKEEAVEQFLTGALELVSKIKPFCGMHLKWMRLHLACLILLVTRKVRRHI